MGGQGSGRLKNAPKPKDMLQKILPMDDIFNPEEKSMYDDLVKVYLSDFDDTELTSSDMDDVLDLAKIRVLEFRLLKASKNSTNKQMDVAAAVERLSKKSEKIKENLSSRRKDRINPNEHKGFSIIDLAAAFDFEKKRVMYEKSERLRAENEEVLKARADYKGNRFDVDVKEVPKE